MNFNVGFFLFLVHNWVHRFCSIIKSSCSRTNVSLPSDKSTSPRPPSQLQKHVGLRAPDLEVRRSQGVVQGIHTLPLSCHTKYHSGAPLLRGVCQPLNLSDQSRDLTLLNFFQFCFFSMNTKSPIRTDNTICVFLIFICILFFFLTMLIFLYYIRRFFCKCSCSIEVNCLNKTKRKLTFH